MTRTTSSAIGIIAVSLAVLGGMALAAQDKYTVKVPDGLAFSEFRGYESWQAVAVSQSGKLALILANPTMIDAYQAGYLATASLSLTAPRWRKSIGSRKKARRLRLRRWSAGAPA